VAYARTYGSELPARQGLREFANRMELQKEHIWVIWVLLVFGMAAFLWDRKLKPHALLMLGLLAFSFLAVSVGFYYRGHYFILLYPALALLVGAGVSAGGELLRRIKVPRMLQVAPILIFLLAFANAVYADRNSYFSGRIHEVCRQVY